MRTSAKQKLEETVDHQTSGEARGGSLKSL